MLVFLKLLGFRRAVVFFVARTLWRMYRRRLAPN
jgi:hypothetical protein